MGLSFTLDMWYRITPLLAKKHRVIIFDNRGVGRSDVPPGPYSIGAMAEDAMAVLDAAEVRQPALLLGASMGGMIAQEMALRYPNRFRALLLACTACDPLTAPPGPTGSVRPASGTGFGSREKPASGLSSACSIQKPPQRKESKKTSGCAPPATARTRRFEPAGGDPGPESYRRLPNPRIPQLSVAHSAASTITSCRHLNGRLIARRIPNAELRASSRCRAHDRHRPAGISVKLTGRFLVRFLLHRAPDSRIGERNDRNKHHQHRDAQVESRINRPPPEPR